MSDTENETKSSIAAEPAKKGGSKMLIIIVLVVVLLGGGGGFYYWRSSAAAAGEEKGTDKAKSKKEKETSDDTETSSKKSSKNDPVGDALPDDSDVKKVIELQPFIVNLADTEQARYLRLTVSLGVSGEGGESEKPDQLFVTRIRNAMLAVLSAKTSDEILSNEGKAKLRKQLLKAAKAASEEPHVEAIYITDFIVQM